MNHFLKQSFKLAHWGNAVESTIVPGNLAVKSTTAPDNFNVQRITCVATEIYHSHAITSHIVRQLGLQLQAAFDF